MAKEDFAVGLLRGLYQGGVGNPEVSERRRQLALQEAFTQQQMDANAAEQGMIRAPMQKPSIGQIIADSIGIGRQTIGIPQYQPDPNAKRGYISPDGTLSDVFSEGSVGLGPKEYRETLIGMAKAKASKSEIPASLLYQISKDQAEKKEGKQLESARVLTMNEGQAVARMLPDVEKAIKANKGKYGPVTGNLAKLNPYNTGAQTFNARMKTASQAFGRFMEGGVLRKEDEEKYRSMFPQIGDLDDVKINKLEIVRRMLAEKYQSDRESLKDSGYNVSGLKELEIPPSIFESKNFNSIEEAEKANLPKGTVIMIGGRKAVVD